jgi:hypothetical protein
MLNKRGRQATRRPISNTLSAALVLSLLTSFAVLGLSNAPASAAFRDHPGLVPENPATGYPAVLSTPTYLSVNNNCPNGCQSPREVLATDQVGQFIVAGGNFLQVLLQNGTTITRPNFAAWNIDTKQLVCPTVSFNDTVTSVAPGPTPTQVYVGGRFTAARGADGVELPRLKIALIDLATCAVDAAFNPAGANGKIDGIAYGNGRLFIGGDFTTIGGQPIDVIAELNALSGAVNPALNLTFSNGLPSSKIRELALAPDGTRLIFAGRFGTVANNGVSVTTISAVIDITLPAAPRLTNHSMPSPSLLNYMQDASVSPDGQLIGFAYGTETLHDAVHLGTTAETAHLLTWRHFMRDSSFGIALSNNAMYLSGHFCNIETGPGPTALMFPKEGADNCTGAIEFNPVTPGVWRSRLAALSLTDGTPLTWNPSSNAFTGGREMTVTSRGLLLGIDGERVNNVRVGALAFLDFGVVGDVGSPTISAIVAPTTPTEQPVVITGTASDDTNIVSVRVRVKNSAGLFLQADGTFASTVANVSTALNPALPAPSTSWSVNLGANLKPGNYVVEATATDPSGKVGSTTAPFAVIASPPRITITSPGTAVRHADPIHVAGSVTDNLVVNRVRVQLLNSAGKYLSENGKFGSTEVDLPANVTGIGTQSASFVYDRGKLPDGLYAVKVIAADRVNPSTVATLTFEIGGTTQLRRAVLSTTGTTTAVRTGTEGYSFTVNAAITVTELGIFDANGNGVLDAANGTPGTVTLWQQNNLTVLGSVNVPTNATPDSGYFYAALTARVTLQPGITYVIGVRTASSLSEPYLRSGSATFDPAIQLQAYVKNATGTDFPDVVSTVLLAVPNMKFS